MASGYAGFSIKQGPKTLGEEALGKAALDTFLRVSAPGVVLWLRQQAPACVPQGLTIERMQMADGKGECLVAILSFLSYGMKRCVIMKAQEGHILARGQSDIW